MITPQQAKRLKNDPDWIALRAHLEECIKAMDSCSTIPDNEDHGEVARGRKLAVRIIREILKPFEIETAEPQDRQKYMMQKHNYPQ